MQTPGIYIFIGAYRQLITLTFKDKCFYRRLDVKKIHLCLKKEVKSQPKIP